MAWIQIPVKPADSSEEESEEDACRIETVAHLTGKEDQITVGVKPVEIGKDQAQWRQVQVKWVLDSGVRYSMLAEKHFRRLVKKNPDIHLTENKIKFKPYSTSATVPVVGKCKVELKNKQGGIHTTQAYVVKGDTESLLGREDAKALGILNVKPDGTPNAKQDNEQDRIRCITPEHREPIDNEGLVSGGQT